MSCSETSDSEFYSCASSDDSVDSFSSIPALADTLQSLISDVPKNFNVFHINAQSITAHFPEMLASFVHPNIHAILISESWLKPVLPSSSVALPGFRLIRNDRIGQGGGGVAIYLRTHIPFTIVSISAQPPPPDAGEHLLIEVVLHHTRLLLGVYYPRSRAINYFSSFEKLLENTSTSYDHTIIAGDFNTCLLKRDYRSCRLESLATALNLNILPFNATHNPPNSTPSLLDLMLVSSPNHVVRHGQCAADDFSYHDLIYLSYKIRPPKAKPKILLLRSFGSMNIDNLCSDALELDWSGVINADSMDEKISQFNLILTKLYDIHAPIHAVKLKHAPAPWLNDEIRDLMRNKLTAKTKLKCRLSDINKEKYISRRNVCNRACRDAQRRHIHNSVENGDPAKVWKFLRSMGIGKSRQDNTSNNLDINLLNQHFSSSSSFHGPAKTATLNHIFSTIPPNNDSFIFNQFTACDVKKSIQSISSDAVGSDSISRKMIMPILDEVVPIILHILNFSISSGSFPVIWKEAQITPLPKKPNPSSFSDFRPISILPFLSKVLERLVHQQLSSYLIKNNLLNPLQSGFRTGHSTVTALTKITDDIRDGMGNGHLTVLSLLDFSNAFNNVDYDILLGLLRSLNISPTVIDWFRSYLSGRRQRIRIDNTYSSWCNISAGVPQGGVLSPLLFAIFINSISQQLISSYHLYADDLQIYTQAPMARLHEAIGITNTDLGLIRDWSRSYGLTVNPTKTQTIIIGSSRMVSKIDWFHLPQVVFDGITIPISETVKNLGILIDRQFSWKPQIAEVSRKIFGSAASLRRLRNFLPITTKTALVKSLLFPILDYADVCYTDLTEEQLDKLERLQNFCIRFIFGLRKYDHVSEFRRKLKWLPIRLRRNTHILSFLYKILFIPSIPMYLKERFEFIQPHSSSLRTSRALQLKIPSSTHSNLSNNMSFTVQAVQAYSTRRELIGLSPRGNVIKLEYGYVCLNFAGKKEWIDVYHSSRARRAAVECTPFFCQTR